MRKTSKLSEVAKIAGVAPITASRAIRGVGYVSEEARARILAAAAQLKLDVARVGDVLEDCLGDGHLVPDLAGFGRRRHDQSDEESVSHADTSRWASLA